MICLEKKRFMLRLRTPIERDASCYDRGDWRAGRYSSWSAVFPPGGIGFPYGTLVANCDRRLFDGRVAGCAGPQHLSIAFGGFAWVGPGWAVLYNLFAFSLEVSQYDSSSSDGAPQSVTPASQYSGSVWALFLLAL